MDEVTFWKTKAAYYHRLAAQREEQIVDMQIREQLQSSAAPAETEEVTPDDAPESA